MESEKDLWNEPSTSKSGQYYQNVDEENQSDTNEQLLQSEITPTTVVLVDKRIFPNDFSVSKALRDENNGGVQKQQTSTSTFFFQSEVQRTLSDPKDRPEQPEKDSPSLSIPEEVNPSEESNKSEERLGPETLNQQVQNDRSQPEVLEQRIYSQNDGKDLNVQTETLPGSSEGVVLDEPHLCQAGPSSAEDAEVKSFSSWDWKKDMHEFISKIYNPSPFIQEQKLEYEKLKYNQYKENVAMKILEKMIRSSMSTTRTTPRLSSEEPLDPEKLDHLTQKVKELEDRLKEIDREMKKSEREKKHLLEQVNELELRALETKKLNLMNQIASNDEPLEKDIEILDQLKDLVKNQDDSTRELKELERQNRIMERLLSQVENSLPSSPWFRSDYAEIPPQALSEHAEESPPPSSPPPPAHRKIHFNKVGLVVYFNNKDFPMRVPHWTSGLAETVSLNDTNKDKKSSESTLDEEDLLEEKMEELRKKKKEEKLVKLKFPMEGLEDDLSNTSDTSDDSSASIQDNT